MKPGFSSAKKVSKWYRENCIKGSMKIGEQAEKHADKFMFLFGLVLLHSAGADFAFAGSGTYSAACNGVLSLAEGTFGAMVTAIAGLAAIIASALGGFKAAWSLLVVSVGSFILRAYITLFNGECQDGASGVSVSIPGVGTVGF